MKITKRHTDLLVAARANSGVTSMFGKEAYQLAMWDYLVPVDSHYELNLRGQDAADEAIEKAKRLTGAR